MKIYLGLLMLVVCVRAQVPRRKGSETAQADPTQQDQGSPDYPSVQFLGETTNQETSMPPTIPGRSVRPGVLRKRTRPSPSPSQQPTTEAYDDKMFTDGSDEYETTTLSEYARLTKNLKFDCSEQAPGFYANVETGCRIWHYCYGAIRYDNICPVQTLFDQEFMTCVYATDTDCSKAPNFYEKNKLLYVTTKKPTNQPGRRKLRRRPSTASGMTTEQPMDYDISNLETLPKKNNSS